MKYLLFALVLLNMLTQVFSNIRNLNEMGTLMQKAILSNSVSDLASIVSPYYGVEISRIEYLVSLNVRFSQKFRYLAQTNQKDNDSGVTWYMENVVLLQNELKYICFLYDQNKPTENYSVEEIKILESTLDALKTYHEYWRIKKPNIRKHKKNDFFTNMTLPQLIKQRRLVTGKINVTIDQKEEYYEYGYFPDNKVGAAYFQFHTDKNGNLWLWAIQ